jgi:ACS family hexuronate transporter-like MFS transporter
MLGATVNYLTRSTLSVSAPTLIKDLHIGPQQYSWINATFEGAIMFQPFCGYLLDVLGLKTGYAISALAWSFINMAHAFARNWPTFAVLRDCWGWRRVRPTLPG